MRIERISLELTYFYANFIELNRTFYFKQLARQKHISPMQIKSKAKRLAFSAKLSCIPANKASVST